ncbi:MAG: hypothetical protein LBR47_04555 [Spirochaetaceae bacterium]|jgi:hypothetical protein|nr:hypothetical protein [Spirochaetaceae bacterium]
MEIHELNQHNWGVCGFAAALQAAAANSRIALGNTDYHTLFPVIKQFCDENRDLEPELLTFSEVFGVNYRYEKLEDVLEKMEADPEMTRTDMGIAMTGKAMSRLCKSLGLTASEFHGTTDTTNAPKFSYSNTIYGLGRSGSSTGSFRYGLLHWVYCDRDKQPMTWGREYTEAELFSYFDKVTHYLPL